MSWKCDVCDKKPLKGNKVSFSNKHHRHIQKPNIQPFKAEVQGTVKQLRVCTSCIRAGKVKKAC